MDVDDRLRDNDSMFLNDVVHIVGELWQLDTSRWQVIVWGQTGTVYLPAAEAAVHISRDEVTGGRVEALQRARARLAQNGVPVVDLLRSVGGATWEIVEGRVVEVEPWVHHDARMNTWPRLQQGAALLARVHNAWFDLDLGAEGEACTWANWISPVDVVVRCERAAQRLDTWHLEALGADVVRLASFTAEDTSLPMQVVHGDFWDNNVYVRDEHLKAVTDFDFLGRRPRIDDLALMLYFADEHPYFHGITHRSAGTRISDLVPLVRAYAQELAAPLSPTEVNALPHALARQPLWTYGKWLLEHPDQDVAHRDAVDTAPAVSRALEIMAEPERWAAAFEAAI